MHDYIETLTREGMFPIKSTNLVPSRRADDLLCLFGVATLTDEPSARAAMLR